MVTQLSLNELLAGLEANKGLLRQKLVLAMIDEGLFRQEGGEIRFAGDRMRPDQLMRIVIDCYAEVLTSVYEDQPPQTPQLRPAPDA
jgi:hypothetical protein